MEPKYLTIKELVAKHTFLKEGGVRWLLVKNPPGLEECLLRIGPRIAIDEDKFFAFLEKYSEETKRKRRNGV